MNTKILTKILAIRMQQIIKRTHPDELGLLHPKDERMVNICESINVLYYINQSKDKNLIGIPRENI